VYPVLKALRCSSLKHHTPYAEDGDLRLGPGGVSEDGNAQYGRLEVFANGGWGVVCDAIDSRDTPSTGKFKSVRPFSDAAVAVACRQLGFQAGEKAVVVRC